MRNFKKVIKTFKKNEGRYLGCEHCVAAILMKEMGIEYSNDGCYYLFGEFIEKFGYEKCRSCVESSNIAYDIAYKLLSKGKFNKI